MRGHGERERDIGLYFDGTIEKASTYCSVMWAKANEGVLKRKSYFFFTLTEQGGVQLYLLEDISLLQYPIHLLYITLSFEYMFFSLPFVPSKVKLCTTSDQKDQVRVFLLLRP